MKTNCARFAVWMSLVWVVLLGCMPVRAADADVLLVLDLGAEAEAGFVSALRIQLAGAYRVVVSSRAVPHRLPERLALATQLMESKHAFATVWMEDASLAASGPRSAVLYVVGRRAGRALLEVVHAPGTRGLDLERMLAIKLGELLSELQAERSHPLRAAEPDALATALESRAAAPSGPVQTAGPVPEPRATAAQASAGGAEPRLWGLLRAGPRFDVGLGSGWSRFGVAGAAVPQLSFGRWRFGLGLGLAAYPSLTLRRLGAEVNLSEVAPRALASLEWFHSDFAIGCRTGPQWSFMSARGTTALGRTQNDRTSSFGWTFGFNAEQRLWRWLAVGASVELQTEAQRLHFDVNGEAVLDRGWLRMTVGIDLRLRSQLGAATR